MSPDEKKILDRINAYAKKAFADIDPKKTKISVQLDLLKPIMQEIADERSQSIEDIFVLYMDLTSKASVRAAADFEAGVFGKDGGTFSSIADNLQ